jgi:hypothetical protein
MLSVRFGSTEGSFPLYLLPGTLSSALTRRTADFRADPGPASCGPS